MTLHSLCLKNLAQIDNGSNNSSTFITSAFCAQKLFHLSGVTIHLVSITNSHTSRGVKNRLQEPITKVDKKHHVSHKQKIYEVSEIEFI